jgi:hypothetical protein
MLWLGLGAIVAAAAAAVFMFQSQGASPAPTAVAPVSPPVAQPAAKAAAPAATGAAPQPGAPVAAADKAAEDGVDPSSLPAVSGKAVNHRVASGPGKSVSVAGGAVDKPPPNPALIAKNIPSSPGESGSLSDAIRNAAPGGTDGTPDKTAPASAPQFSAGSVPQRPSGGAIAGGIGAVMGEARACLGLDDPISYAAVTFESSGAVAGVAVTGFAAGKPAEACIKAALGKAKVPPFAQPTYKQTFTVRPNS